MSRRTLRDDKYHVIGYIDVDGRTGQQTLLDKYHHKLGYYHPDDDETRDEYHRRVGSGNLLTILLANHRR